MPTGPVKPPNICTRCCCYISIVPGHFFRLCTALTCYHRLIEHKDAVQM